MKKDTTTNNEELNGSTFNSEKRKGLEALERLRHTPMSYYESKEPHSYKENIVIIEKELKALEIIKKKKVNIFLFKECCKNKWKMPYSYNQSHNKRRQLKEEEYNLLKEIL